MPQASPRISSGTPRNVVIGGCPAGSRRSAGARRRPRARAAAGPRSAAPRIAAAARQVADRGVRRRVDAAGEEALERRAAPRRARRSRRSARRSAPARSPAAARSTTSRSSSATSERPASSSRGRGLGARSAPSGGLNQSVEPRSAARRTTDDARAPRRCWPHAPHRPRPRDLVRSRHLPDRLGLRGPDPHARPPRRRRAGHARRPAASPAGTPASTSRWLARMAPFMPFAVRLHLAVSLIGLLSLGFYLSPAMDLQADVDRDPARRRDGRRRDRHGHGLPRALGGRAAARRRPARDDRVRLLAGAPARRPASGSPSSSCSPAPAAGRPTTSSAAPREPSLAAQAPGRLGAEGRARASRSSSSPSRRSSRRPTWRAALPRRAPRVQRRPAGRAELERPGVRPRRRRDRGALRAAADLRRAPAGLRADRRHPVQRDAVVLRHDRAASATCRSTARCSCCWSTAPTRSCDPRSPRCGPSA